MYIIKFCDKNGTSKTMKAKTLREINDRVRAIYSSGGKLLRIKGEEYGDIKRTKRAWKSAKRYWKW